MRWAWVVKLNFGSIWAQRLYSRPAKAQYGAQKGQIHNDFLAQKRSDQKKASRNERRGKQGGAQYVLLKGILLAASPQNSKATMICGSSADKPRRIDDTGNTGMDVTDAFDNE